ncbi:MAG TPA: hypothetical protein PKO22_01865 [Treponemataceae bacterium]|nr:hypothetical protein [Treponemataceae bacterium]
MMKMGTNQSAVSDELAPEIRNGRELLNKVPQITAFFWIIKVLCTTVGETAADYLNVGLNFGLLNTAIAMSVVLLVSLVFQVRSRKYVAGIYWWAVTVISVVGTLITDLMTDEMGIPLTVSTIGFAIALIATFAIWYVKERTLSIHRVNTVKREVFYWLAILFTFALGTAAGDLVSETINLGYPLSVVLFAAAIGAVAIAHYAFKLDAVWCFWIAYILTRPLGASIGDFLSQPSNGGIGLGYVITSYIFLATILGVVIFLSVTKIDELHLPKNQIDSGEKK